MESEKDEKEATRSGKSEHIEIFEFIPNSDRLASVISAFANTKGGVIIIGISDQGEITGVNCEKITKVYNESNNLLDVNENSTVKFIEGSHGRFIAVVSVPCSIKEIVSLKSNGIAFERNGSETIPISARRISESIKKALRDSEDDTYKYIDVLARKIEKLTHYQAESGVSTKRIENTLSWKNQSAVIVVSGIVGALISALLAIIL